MSMERNILVVEDEKGSGINGILKNIRRWKNAGHFNRS